MLAGILLAGGESKRMGIDKAFIKFRGKYLFEHSLSVLKEYTKEIFISSSNHRFSVLGIEIVPDETPGIGPVGGIFTCLKRSGNTYNLVLPCDTPFINHLIIDKLTSDYLNYDITVIRNKNGDPEPLIGIYSKKVLPLLKEQIQLKKFKIQEILQRSSTNYVDLTDDIYAENPNIICNINTPGELKKIC